MKYITVIQQQIQQQNDPFQLHYCFLDIFYYSTFACLTIVICLCTMYQASGGDFAPLEPIDYGVEYCVYDVTPDVSIDFVSFTTEESEG